MSKSKLPRIYINASGGVVTSVMCTVPAECVIIDWDNDDPKTARWNEEKSKESIRAVECAYVK